MKILWVDNIKAHLKRYSVQALAAVATLQAAWLGLDLSLKAALPEYLVNGLSAFFAVAGLIGAFIKQDEAKNDP
jgi:hypothetical protein